MVGKNEKFYYQSGWPARVYNPIERGEACITPTLFFYIYLYYYIILLFSYCTAV